MAENDKQQLENYRKQREELILDLSRQLRENYLFNSDSIMFGLKEMPNGPTLVARTNLDYNKMPSGWKYEPSYLLESDYPQEGLVGYDKDGKKTFIPIVHENNKTEEVHYHTPNDIRDGILSVNYPAITPDQIKIEPSTNSIKLINVINDPIMPQGLKFEDGKIVSSLDPGRTFEIVRENAHEDYTTIEVGEKTDTNLIERGPLQDQEKEDPLQGPYAKDIYRAYNMRPDLNKPIDAGIIETVLFHDMQRVFLNYTRNANGDVVSQANDGSYSNLTNQKVDRYRDEQIYQVAEAWVMAYALATGHANAETNAFTNEVSCADFDVCFEKAKMMRGRSITEFAQIIAFENPKIVDTMIYFVTNPKISFMFGIDCSEITPDAATTIDDKVRTEKTIENINAMIAAFKGEKQEEKEEKEEKPVEEKKEETNKSVEMPKLSTQDFSPKEMFDSIGKIDFDGTNFYRFDQEKGEYVIEENPEATEVKTAMFNRIWRATCYSMVPDPTDMTDAELFSGDNKIVLSVVSNMLRGENATNNANTILLALTQRTDIANPNAALYTARDFLLNLAQHGGMDIDKNGLKEMSEYINALKQNLEAHNEQEMENDDPVMERKLPNLNQ